MLLESRARLEAGPPESGPCAASVFSIPYPSACISRWSGRISPNRIGWLGGEVGAFEDGRVGSLDAWLKDGRRGLGFDVGELPPASVAVFGLLILLAKDAPLLACGRLEVAFVWWEGF